MNLPINLPLKIIQTQQNLITGRDFWLLFLKILFLAHQLNNYFPISFVNGRSPLFVEYKFGKINFSQFVSGFWHLSQMPNSLRP